MPKLFSADALARVRQVAASFASVVCGTASLLAFYSSWLLWGRPVEVLPSTFDTVLLDFFGTDALGDLTIFGFCCLAFCFVFWFTASLQAREWKGHNHEEMLRLMKDELPNVVRDAQSDGLRKIDEVLLFHRLVTNVKARTPRLRSEYAEYLAQIAVITVTNTSQILRAVADATEQTEAIEPLVATATSELAHAERSLAQLQKRFEAMREATDGGQLQYARLQAETATLLQKLDEMRSRFPSNVVSLTATGAGSYAGE